MPKWSRRLGIVPEGSCNAVDDVHHNPELFLLSGFCIGRQGEQVSVIRFYIGLKGNGEVNPGALGLTGA